MSNWVARIRDSIFSSGASCSAMSGSLLLSGREVMPHYGLEPQVVMTFPLLVGTDGEEKMSKSKGNYIGITEAPKVMFRKIMGISDTLMWRYWELLTDASLAEIAAMKSRDPMEVKMELAGRIVTDFHSAAEAKQAGEDFDREVRQGGEPADIVTVDYGSVREIRVPQMLVELGTAPTRTEAERLIKSGALEIDGVRYTALKWTPHVGTIPLRTGKKWIKITVKA
jgi:tyrosyl-tRNA synthetase